MAANEIEKSVARYAASVVFGIPHPQLMRVSWPGGLEPIQVHLSEELGRDRKARFAPNDTVDSTSRTESRLIVIRPVRDLVRRTSPAVLFAVALMTQRTASSTPAACAFLHGHS